MTRDQMKVLIERLYLIWNTGDLSSIPRSQRRHLDRPCRRSSTGHDTALPNPPSALSQASRAFSSGCAV